MSVESTSRESNNLFMKDNPMATNAGVWIDHRKAVLVRMTESGEEIREISSKVDKPYQPPTGPASKQPGRPSGFVPEDVQEHKTMNQLNVFYDEVLTSLHGADALLILGPGEAKGEFHKRLKSKKFACGSVEVETTDQLTDPQIAAHVREHFSMQNQQVRKADAAQQRTTKSN